MIQTFLKKKKIIFPQTKSQFHYLNGVTQKNMSLDILIINLINYFIIKIYLFIIIHNLINK